MRKNGDCTENNEKESPGGEIILYRAEDGRVRLEVRLQDETVWLTQPLMAKLFQTTQQNISQHIKNIYDEGELEPGATHKKFLSVRLEGDRQVRRSLDFYNLDMIISALRKAHGEYEKFRSRQLDEPTDVEKDFIRAEKEFKRIEASKKKRRKIE